MVDLLFITYADRKYEMFVIPYIYFALKNNDNSFVETILEDKHGFVQRNKVAIDIMEKMFPNQFGFKQSSFVGQNIIPNTIRFLEPPSTLSKYVYIGDIDLLVFDNIQEIHLNLIRKNIIPFSNIIRDPNAEKPRLTGLHFCEYDKFYPAPILSDIDLRKENDEHVLYLYMMKKGLMVDSTFRSRPECGIHLSLNRDPIGRTTGPNSGRYDSDSGLRWGGEKYYGKFLSEIKSSDFLNIYPHLDIELRIILIALEAIATDEFEKLHWQSANIFIDKRLTSSKKQYSTGEFTKERDILIKEKHFEQAEQLNKIAAIIWPNNIDILKKLSWILMVNEKPSECVSILNRIRVLSGGSNFLKSWDFIYKHNSTILSIDDKFFEKLDS